MKALVYTAPETLEFKEVADPAPQSGEQLVRIERVGICGSDMHAYLGHDERRPAPLILGHEAAGIITGGLRDGERVTVNPLVTCGACLACTGGRDNLCPERQIISMPPREGAFAQWLAMPGDNLISVPDHVPLEKAALAEPIACGWHAVRLGLAALGGKPDGIRALTIGGGAIGLGAALCLKAQGVSDITLTESNTARRQLLAGSCDFTAISGDIPDGARQFDLVIDGVGIAATRARASTSVRPGGVIMHIGLGESAGGLDVRRMTLQEVTFIGTYTYTALDFRDTAEAIYDGRLGALDWLEIRDLSDGAEAFNDIRSGRVPSPKIILTPPV